MRYTAVMLFIFLILCFKVAANEQIMSTTVFSEKLEKGIEKGVQYFSKKGGDIRPYYLTSFFPYLHRKFGISQLSVIAKHGESFYNNPETPQTEKFLIRLVYPERSFQQRTVNELTSSNKMLALGLYCDAYGISETYMGLLTAFAQVGWYGVTHSVISLQWAIENKCFPTLEDQKLQQTQNKRLEELRALQLIKMLEEIEESEGKTDLGMEAIAFLYYSGHRSSVQQKWVVSVMNGQKSDGGWAHRQKEEISIDHPSLFGLWILLEAAYPERPALPMIFKR